MKHIYKMEYTLKPCITHKTNVDATEKKKKNLCVPCGSQANPPTVNTQDAEGVKRYLYLSIYILHKTRVGIKNPTNNPSDNEEQSYLLAANSLMKSLGPYEIYTEKYPLSPNVTVISLLLLEVIKNPSFQTVCYLLLVTPSLNFKISLQLSLSNV